MFLKHLQFGFFLKNMGILKVIIQTEKEQMWKESRTGCRRQRTRKGSRHKRGKQGRESR